MIRIGSVALGRRARKIRQHGGWARAFEHSERSATIVDIPRRVIAMVQSCDCGCGDRVGIRHGFPLHDVVAQRAKGGGGQSRADFDQPRRPSTDSYSSDGAPADPATQHASDRPRQRIADIGRLRLPEDDSAAR